MLDHASVGPTTDTATIAAITRFNDAFGRQDIDAVMAAMTEDCVFEDTEPPPDGKRSAGQEAVRAASSPAARFETEEVVAGDDRCVVRWVYRWDGADGDGHIRGVNLFRVRDGKVVEKLAYVKG